MTGLLLRSDRLVTDRGERLEAQPKAPRRSRFARLLAAWPYIVPLLVLCRGLRAYRAAQHRQPVLR